VKPLFGEKSTFSLPNRLNGANSRGDGLLKRLQPFNTLFGHRDHFLKPIGGCLNK
jgi:hypothetical protein